MPFVLHTSLSFRTYILHCLQMLVFFSFKASGLNLINKRYFILKEWLEMWPLWCLCLSPLFLEVWVWVPHGVTLKVCGRVRPWQRLGSRPCFPGHLLSSLWWTPNPDSQGKALPPRWPQWIWQCRASRLCPPWTTGWRWVPWPPSRSLPMASCRVVWEAVVEQVGVFGWHGRAWERTEDAEISQWVSRWPSQHCAHPF